MMHTRGPWILIEPIKPDGKHYAAGSVVVIAREGAFPKEWNIAGISTYSPNSEANACLISAAPDMLAALQAVMAEWREGYGLNAADQVRAAITKATGVRP